MKIKDLFGAIFMEDIEDDEYDDEYYDDEYDDEDYYEDDYQDEYYDDRQNTESYPAREEYEQTYVEPQVTANIPTPAPVQKQSTFTSIEIDSRAREERLGKEPQKKQPYKYDRSKTQKPIRRTPAEDLEYTQVISPIFGNMEESEKEHSKVHDAIVLPKPDETDFTKIISPMYGNTVPKYGRLSSIPEMDPQEALELKDTTPVNEVKATLTLKDMLAKQNEKEVEQTELLDD